MTIILEEERRKLRDGHSIMKVENFEWDKLDESGSEDDKNKDFIYSVSLFKIKNNPFIELGKLIQRKNVSY